MGLQGYWYVLLVDPETYNIVYLVIMENNDYLEGEEVLGHRVIKDKPMSLLSKD